MARRKRAEEHENHERWLVSYADFITLLFAFFTSMYAISSVNEGKFRVMSESLAIAFNPSLYTSASLNEGPRFAEEQNSGVTSSSRDNWYTSHYKKVREALSSLESGRKLSLIMEDNKLKVRIQESGLFVDGSDELLPEAMAVLDEVAAALEGLPNAIRIEGHTDNVPINTPRFPSNWDLSSARALQILKYFLATHRYDPTRLSAVGYGEYRPVATNNTPSGRRKNRRVDISILGAGTDS